MRAAIEAAPFIHPKTLRHSTNEWRRFRRCDGTSEETINESDRGSAQGHRTSALGPKGLIVEAVGFACSGDLLARQPLSKVPCHEIQRGLSFTNTFNGGCAGGVLSPMGNIFCADGALVKWANHVDTITA